MNGQTTRRVTRVPEDKRVARQDTAREEKHTYTSMKSQRVVGLTRSIPGIRLVDLGRLLLTGLADDGEHKRGMSTKTSWPCMLGPVSGTGFSALPDAETNM